MEDLETVSKEKDKIEKERLKAEAKFEESRKAAAEEKMNFSAVQKEAADRLEALQAGMAAKQKIISDLTKAQTDATTLAGNSMCHRFKHLDSNSIVFQLNIRFQVCLSSLSHCLTTSQYNITQHSRQWRESIES